MANDKRYELWNNLSKKGNFGTYEEFDAALDNPKNLRAAYDLVSSDGDVGSFDDWSSSVKRDAPQSSSPAPSSTPSPEKTAGVDTAPPMGDSAPQLTDKLPSTEYTPEVPTDPVTLSPPPREQGASKEIYDANVLALRAFQNEWDDALSRYDTLSSGTVGADGSHVDPFDWSSESDQKYVAAYAAGLREYSDASKYNTDDLQQAFIRIMRSPNYRSDKERAAAVLPIVEELNARRNGGHAKTLGERYAEDYLATRPDLRSAYEKWQKGDEPGYISDADKVPVLREGYDADGNWYVVKGEDDTPVTKIASRIVSNIEDKISELIAEKRNPSLGKSLLQNSRPGDMFAEGFDDAVEFAKAYNVTDALKEELGKYNPIDWESYIVGYAAKNDIDMDSARNRVISLIVESAVNRLSEKTAPEGSIDYTLRKVVGDLFVSNAVKASIALSAYRPGDIGIFHIDEQGMEQAIKSGRVGATTQVVAELSKFAIDAKMLGFRLAELAGRGGSSLAFRALGGFTKAGGRSALRSGVKRAASEIVGSSLNFGTYMTYTEGLRQLRMGDYSWSELGKSGLKGLKEGAALGVVSKSFDGLFSNATGWMVPIGETMKFLGEGATFATFGYLDTGKLTAQDIGSSFGMALMARVGHGGQLLRDIRNRMENREDYGKKVTVHKISVDEANSLREGGYPTIASALRGGAVTKFDLDALESELEAMRKDTNVPWETVRMADYVFNGKVAPLPLMLGVNVKPDGDRFVITPTDGKKRAIGGAVTVDSPSAAVTVFNDLMDDANRNSIALGEHQCLSSGFQRASGSAVIEWSNSRNLGESPLAVWRVYQNALKKSVRGEELGEYENEVYTGVNGLLGKQEVHDMVGEYRSRLLSQGIDIDAILSKPSHDRTRQETAAVDDYERFLASEVGDPNLVDDASFSAWAGGRKTNLELSGYKGATAEVAQEESSAPEQSQEPVTKEPVVATPLVDGRVADLGDFSELFPGEDFDSLDGERQSSVLSMLEGERALSHAYAAGRTTEVPEHWEYWKSRDGLKEPGGVVADTAEVEETPTPVQDAMPMKDVDGKQRPDYGAASAEQSHRYIYEEKGYTKEQGDQLVSNTITKKQGVLAEKESALAKAQEAVSRGPEVELSEDTESEWESAQEKLQADLAKAQSERDAAASDLAKWERIRAIESERAAVVAEPTPTEEVQPTEEVEPIEEVPDVQDEGGEKVGVTGMPMVNKGNGRYSPDFKKATAEQIWDYMTDQDPDGSTHDQLIEGRIAMWSDKVKGLEKREPKMSKFSRDKKVKDPIAAHKRAVEKWKKEVSDAESQRDKWEEVKRKRLDYLHDRGMDAIDGNTAAEIESKLGDYLDLTDYIMRNLRNYKFKWRGKGEKNSTRGLGEHLGLHKSNEERRAYFPWLSKDGMYPETVAEVLWSDAPEWLKSRYDDIDFFNEVLDVMKSYPKPLKMMRAAAERHREAAEAADKWYDQQAENEGFDASTVPFDGERTEPDRPVVPEGIDFGGAEGDVPFSLKEESVADRDVMSGDVRVRLEERLGKEMSDRIEGIAKSLGVKVRFTDEDVNGLMDNEEGVLYIGKDLDADKTEVFVVGHELTHRMQNQSEAKGSGVYSAFKQVALDWAKAHQEEGGNGYDFSLIKGKYERFFRDKYKAEGLRMGMTDEQASAYAEKKVGEKVTDDYVNDEIAANVAGRMMMNPKVVEDMFRVRPADPEKARGWRRALEWLRDFLNERFERIMGKRTESLSAEDRRLVELRNKFNDMYTELVRDDLADQGVDTAENGDARYAAKDILEGKERDEAVKDLMRVTGRSEATVKKWLKAEESLASVILSGDNQRFLDMQVDESVPSIWKNSDYPQGTVEFSNICRKRLPFTMIYQRLQEEFPNRVFDASTLEDIRRIMKENGEDVACGLCFVEDRRQLLGEIGDGFIKAVKGGNTDINEKQKKALDKLRESGDKYVPNLYELLTLDGMKKLRKSHPAVAQAFTEYNNARGMQAGRLFQAYSAYHRDIRKWSKEKVESVNDAGGLRIFSFSDFEAHHLIDLVQVIIDCASKGVKVQGYTKVPEFAKAVMNTKVKLNRSLIAKDKGFVDEGYVPQEGEAVSPNVIDGKRLLLDTVEGIDVNHPDFFDSTDNKNVGNILVGINDEQIRLAMLDPFVDYIIPFHSGLSEALRTKKGIGDWVNYKLIQLEKKYNDKGNLVNADKHGINIYTDVLPRGEELIGRPIRTARDFQLAFFKACAERGWVPRFSKFINTNKKGEYVYTPGYEKLLIDFKLFDKRGRLLPQEAVEPRFDNEFNKTILDKYVEGEKSREPYDELYAKVKEGLGLESVGDGEVYSLKEEDKKLRQGFGSAATSQNQVAGAFRKIKWNPGTTNVDIGGGRFDKATDYLKGQGVESMVFDPFNRDSGHNKAVAERVRDEKVDTVTCNNVLNVIDSEQSRANVILQAAKALKEGGTAYFSVYEGDKSGVGRQTKTDSWQNNRRTKDYIPEIEKYFDDVTLKNGVITARNPKPTNEKSVWDFDGSYSGNDIRFSLREDVKERENRRDSEESKKLFDATKEKFGTTNDFKEAGYILPDGTMLDFSGRHLMNKGDDTSHLAGNRAVDHRAIHEVGWDDNEGPTGFKTSMTDFIERGAIRINGPYGINLSVPPTREQAAVLRRYFQGKKVVSIDFGNGDNTEHAVWYGDDSHPNAPYPNVSRILADIDRYFYEGIKPKGDPYPYFSLKDDERRPTFYSNAERAVENVKQEKATAEQWKAMLTKAGGIKAGEDKWMGLSTWLDENKGKSLTKDEVLQFVRDNGVKMVEREYIEAPYSFESLKREYDQWLHDEGFDYAQKQLLERFGDDADIAFDDLGGELVIANEGAAAALLGSEDIINSTRLDYTTEGLDNKREIAFVLPDVEPYQEHDEIHFGPENEGKAVMWVRFGETTDADGKRVLVIDEIQSNRHQKARESGYKSEFENSANKKYREAVKAIDKFQSSMKEKYGSFYLSDQLTTEEKAEYERLYKDLEETGDAKTKEKKTFDIPDAPFEKNWHEVAMKRMLRLAAEEGFDKVAWTTGEQQAKRYSLGRMYDSIEREDNPSIDGKRFVLSGRNMDTFLVNKEGSIEDSSFSEFNGKPLSDVVGKDLAERMMNLEDGDIIEGEQLNIGGEGMKGFYDQMLPRFMDKYGKRWGAKVGEVTLSTPGKEVMHSVDVTPAMKESVMQGQPLFQVGEVAPAEGVRARDYTARTIKKLRSAGVRVQIATREEARRMADVAKRVGAELMTVFHGSGAKFDAFDHSHMGEGEGAQAYGWGTYVTQVDGIARTYAKSSARKPGNAKFRGIGDKRNLIEHLTEQGAGNPIWIANRISSMIHALSDGESLADVKAESVATIENSIKRTELLFDGFKKEVAADKEILERIENMSDEEFANADFWYESAMASDKWHSDAWKKAAKYRDSYGGKDYYKLNGETDKDVVTRALHHNLEYKSEAETIADYETDLANAKYTLEFVKGLQESDFDIPKRERFVYDVEIPDNDGTNYLPYGEYLSDAQRSMVAAKLKDLDGYQTLVRGMETAKKELWDFQDSMREKYGAFWESSLSGAEASQYRDLQNGLIKLANATTPLKAIVDGKTTSDTDSFNRLTGSGLQLSLETHIFNSPKEVSEFLSGCGFVGVEYPAQYRSGGREDGAKNYVIFKESDAKITNVTEFLRTSDGTIYGWHDNAGIHLTEDGFNPDTPLHEYTHGFMRMLKERDPETYDRVVSGLRESRVWREVLEDDAYADIRDDETSVASEVAARLSGRENARRVSTEFDRGGYFSIANAVAVRERVRNALQSFWDRIAEWFGAKFDKAIPADRLARMTLRALDEGVNPDAVSEGAAEFQSVQGVESGAGEQYSLKDAESVRDVVLETIPRLDESNKGDKNARVAAMKAIGGNLSKLRQAMSKQRAYDRETVKKVTDFAKEMIGSGLFSDLEDWEVRRMLTRVKDATGKESIVGELNKLFDLMVNHQLKEGARTFEKILSTKGTKVDSRGIVVAAGLDDRGVRMMNALKESLSLDEASLNDRISSVQDKLGDSSSVVRENAEAEYDGLLVAQRYFDTIKTYQGYETQYKQMLADAKDDHTAGRMSDENYREYKHVMDEVIRANRLNMVESYGELSEMLGYGVEASKARLKEWRDGQRRRVEEIRHDANRDMQGRDADIHQKPLKGAAKVKGVMTDNLAHKILLNPLGTFENYMRYFGSKFADGAGNLYNRFVRGGIDAQDASWKSYKSSIDTLDAKYRELFGKSSGHAIDMYKLQNSKNRITVKTTSGEYDLNQLSAAYIYCVNKQVDGRMKLRKMGIDEDQVAQIASKVDPRILKYFDWVQSEFLPGMRDRINETHKRVYGASMDNIAGYFPLRVNPLSSHGGRNTQTTLESGNKDLPRVSTSTGGIIKRTVNTLDLDITRVDALQVLLEHVRDMEHWNAYAEYSRDLNTLLGYKRFEAQVKNSMSLRYGDGKGIWDDFVKCAQVTTGDYRPKTNKLGENVTKLTSQWAASNIAIRLWTAVKQFQSGVVGATQADWWSLTRNFGKLFNLDTWNWAIENLPLFAERWESRKVGDTTLDAIDVQRGGKTRWDRFLSSAARVGITPNAAIDGATVAILGRSIYETRYKKYRKFGYSEELAKKRALQDASISVNETQQSSQGMFKSVVQSDRDVLSRIASMYRNASMGYERMAVRGAVSMKNVFSKGWSEEALRVTKDMAMRDGLTAEQAGRVAKSAVRREFFRGLANFAMFGSIAPLTWAGFGKLLPLLFTGQNDGDQLKEGLSESLIHGLSGFFEGFIGGATFGDLAEFFFGGTGDDEKKWSDAVRKMGNSDPLMEEFKKAGGKIDSKKWEACYDIANLFISSQVGVNPKTLVNWYAAGADLFAGDLGELRNWCLFGARLFNMPESATQGVYIKELGLRSDEVKKLSIDEVASRYAHYKRLQGAGYMNLFSPSSYDQDIEDKYRKKYDELLQERLSSMSEEELSRILHEDPREDVKQAVIKSLTKAQGLDYKAPSSGGGEVYERHLVMNDLVEDNAIKSVYKRLSPIKKGWEDLGGGISDKGLMVNEKKSGKEWFDKDKLDAYYAEHKSELDTLLVLHRWQSSFSKYKKQLDEKGADPVAVMERLRAGRKQALKDLGK